MDVLSFMKIEQIFFVNVTLSLRLREQIIFLNVTLSFMRTVCFKNVSPRLTTSIVGLFYVRLLVFLKLRASFRKVIQ